MKNLKNHLIFKTAVVLFVLIFAKSASSQVGQQWMKTYTSQSFGYDIINDMVLDSSGNIYVTGESDGQGTFYDYATIKYNPAGVQQWVSRYNGPAQTARDVATGIAVDNAGNVYVTGYTDNPTISGEDITTIKYNPQGIAIWVKVYNSLALNDDRGYDIAVDNAGNVYVTGYTKDINNNFDVITIKYNSAGVQQWLQKYNSSGTNGDIGNAIQVDASGNVYVAGAAYSNALLIKYNSTGVQQWTKTYNGPGNAADNFRQMVLDASGNIYTSGESSNGPGNYDFAVVKFNSAGTQLWSKNYAGPGAGDDLVKGLKVDAAGNVYVTGESKGASSGKDYATVKYNSTGTQQWVARYNGPDNLSDEGFAVTVDTAGSVYVTGKSKGSATQEDFATVKYNSAGVQQWVMRHNGSADDEDYGKSIAVDNSGNIIVSGVGNIGGSDDYCTIKYSPITGVQINGGEIPQNYSLSQNYPNPFNPSTSISFSIPAAVNVKIAVYDMLGRELSVIVNEYLNAGNYQAEFNASALSSGTYFYKMTAGDFSEVKKMILVK
jgi:uncharacterized delta-60 repeat protein